MSALDQVVAFVRVLGSTLLGSAREPVFNVSAIGDFDSLDADPGGGETAPEQLGHAPLGFVARPLDADDDGFAEAIALRVDGGLQPLGWRDLRINRMLNPDDPGATPAKGQQLFAGYGGAFLSHSMTEEPSGDRRANISVWYVPHDFSGRTPGKAHAIIIDPTEGNSSLQLVHADGMRVVLTEDTGNGPGILLAVNGETFLRMSDGELTLAADKIMAKGNVYLGAQAEAGVPLLAGALSPPSPSVYVSPV